MDRTDLIRLRWRLSGAWMWPSFLVLTVVDATFVHLLPPQGETEGVVLAWIESTVLMMLVIAFLSPLGGIALRRMRRDLPRTVARNYAGAFGVLAVSLFLLLAGVINHHSVTLDRAAYLDASQRAEAWIGDHAPPKFQADVQEMNTLPIQIPQIYRSCVTDLAGTENYCVVVNRARPFGTGVKFDGHESNQLLSQGAN